MDLTCEMYRHQRIKNSWILHVIHDETKEDCFFILPNTTYKLTYWVVGAIFKGYIREKIYTYEVLKQRLHNYQHQLILEMMYERITEKLRKKEKDLIL